MALLNEIESTASVRATTFLRELSAFLFVTQVVSADTSLIVVREKLAAGPLSADRVIQFPIELQVAVMLWKGAPSVVNIEVKCFTSGQTETVPIRVIKGQHAGMNKLY